MLKNINTKQHGFTLVELLIVIVVIAILAVISVVAYNGITNRGKSSTAAALANNIIKKAEAYNTLNSSYPTTLTAFKAGAGEAALDTATQNAIKNAAPSPWDEKQVYLQTCSTATPAATGVGIIVTHWDPQTGSSSTKNVTAGYTSGTHPNTGTISCAAFGS